MILLAQGKKQAEIAKALGRSSSTISRELKRHALESYSATNAQNSYLKHRQNSKAQRKLEQPEYFNLVQEKFLTENWSPEQISARLKLEKSELSISYSTIYRGIYSGLFDIILSHKKGQNLHPLPDMFFASTLKTHITR